MRAKPSGSWWRDRLARLCWAVLDKLRALEPFLYSQQVYSYGEAEQGAVTDMIVKAMQAAYDGVTLFDPGDHCIVLGAKEFSELMRDMPVHDTLTVSAAPICRGAGVYRAEYQGLPVHVVPRLSGVAILPKAIIEVRRKAA